MTKKFSMLFLVLIIGTVVACSTKKSVIELSDCYSTKAIDSIDFMNSDNSIKSNLGIQCDDGYVMTGLTQTAEKEPGEFGQFIIVSEIKCCRPSIE